jgi:glycosyltransferase involved in cell wall biosynthesis
MVSPGAMGDNAPRALALIDYADHTRGGHFASYLVLFSRAFAARFDTVLVFTPDPQRTTALLGLSQPGAPKNVSCHPLPPGPRKRFYRLKRKPCPLVKIFQKATALAPGHRLRGFIMWGYDLLIAQVAEGKSGVPWATFISITFSNRGYHDHRAEVELRLRELCENHPDCASALVWDRYLLSPGPARLQWCPGCENVEFSPGNPIAETIRNYSRGRFCIGGVGLLTGQRCLNELLLLAEKHPEISFVLVGRIDEKSVREDLRPLLGPGRLPHLLALPGFKTDEEINAAAEACDAILIDGSHYPLHSGIACKALFFGKFLLTPESNSWICDVIREYRVGLAYTDPALNFTHACNLWKQDGGPLRSKQAAENLMGPVQMNRCFDEITRRLDAAALRLHR